MKFTPFRPWCSMGEDTQKMEETRDDEHSSTPLLDEKTPKAPLAIQSLKSLLPSIPSLGEISAFSHSCPNEVYFQTVLNQHRPENADTINIENTDCSETKDLPESNITPTAYPKVAHIDKVLLGTNLVPSRTLVKTDEKGNIVTFSNIKAPPLLERKPFRCDKCPKRYAYIGNLYRHKRSKHSDAGYLFECPYCLYRNGRKDNLKQHIRADHPGQHVPKNVQIKPYDPRESCSKPVLIRPVEAVTKTVQDHQDKMKPKCPKFRIIERRTPNMPSPTQRKDASVVMNIESDPNEIRQRIRDLKMKLAEETTATKKDYWGFNAQGIPTTYSTEDERWNENYRFPNPRTYKRRQKTHKSMVDKTNLDISMVKTSSTRNMSPYAYKGQTISMDTEDREIFWSNVTPYKYSRADKYYYRENEDWEPISIQPVYMQGIHTHMWPLYDKITTPRRSFLNKVQEIQYREMHGPFRRKRLYYTEHK